MLKRLGIFVYGVVSYALFFATYLYAIGFIGNVFVPKSLDAAATTPLVQALLINCGLLGLFAVQHSLMARPFFKRAWTRVVPEEAERSTYVLFSSVCLILLFAFWQPMGGVIWNVQNTIARQMIFDVCMLGFAIVLVSTFLINHFDLFGLRQVWLQLVGKPYTHLEFHTPLFYKYVRHPLYVGWLMAFWATPTMTAAHLLFAIMTTAYILTAIHWEERDLIVAHGEKYEDYRNRVPKLIPATQAYAPRPVTELRQKRATA